MNYEYRPGFRLRRRGTPVHPLHIEIANLDGTGRERLELLPEEGGGYPTWSSDGKHITVILNEAEPRTSIRVVSDDVAVYPLRVFGASGDFGLKWSPDRMRVTYHQPYDYSGGRLAHRIAMTRVDPERTGLSPPRFSVANKYISQAAWSHNGDRVYYAVSEGTWSDITQTTLYAMEVNGADAAFIADIRPERRVRSVEPSPDGSRFLITSLDTVPVSVMDADGSNSATLCCPSQLGNAGWFWASWSPDGEWVALLDTSGRVSRPNVLQIMRPDGSDARTLIHRNEDGSLTPGTAR